METAQEPQRHDGNSNTTRPVAGRSRVLIGRDVSRDLILPEHFHKLAVNFVFSLLNAF